MIHIQVKSTHLSILNVDSVLLMKILYELLRLQQLLPQPLKVKLNVI